MAIDPNSITAYLNMEQPKQRATVSGNSTGKATAATPSAGKSDGKTASKDGDGFSFGDLIDIINPLQHIPIVSTIYREITGDKISNFSRIAGGALFGGFAGAIFGGINAVAVTETGKDVGELAMAKVGIGHDKTATASASSAPVGTSTKSSDENIPVIEVHPQAKAAAQPKPTLDAALDEPKTATVPLAANLKSAGPHAMSSQLLAQHIRHYDIHSGASAKLETDRAKLGLPESENIGNLKPVDNTPHQDSALNDVQVPQEMMQALAKYQSMQGAIKPDNAGEGKTDFSAMTSDASQDVSDAAAVN